jgi:hypothetical protein
MQQLLSLDIQLFLGHRQIEAKDLQGVGDRWGNLGHIRKSDNRSISLSITVRGASPGNRLQTNRWVGRVKTIAGSGG